MKYFFQFGHLRPFGHPRRKVSKFSDWGQAFPTGRASAHVLPYSAAPADLAALLLTQY